MIRTARPWRATLSIVRRPVPALGRLLAASLCFCALRAHAEGAGAPRLYWTESTGSPRPMLVVKAAERELAGVCPDGDSALRTVAAQLAAHTVAADDVEAITYA